ncbi:hypothetical protein BH10BDE1_BH10BDE1_33820 [soil metagenome]
MNRLFCQGTLALFALVFSFTVISSTTAAQDAQSLHYAEVFLNSLYGQGRILAPRLGLTALHTFIAHPSLLERWHIINSDAAASYNGWTRTLVLQPEMTKHDVQSNRERIRSLREMNQTVGPSARVSAAVAFHEMSHGEWDLYVKNGAQPYDRELMRVVNRELGTIILANDVSTLESLALASEIFAYYREELISTILNDAAEIKMASGIDPDTYACTPLRKRPTELRDFSSNPTPYETRVRLSTVWVRGHDIDLERDKALAARMNSALFAHAKASLSFPASRDDLRARLSKDRAIRAALTACEKL